VSNPSGTTITALVLAIIGSSTGLAALLWNVIAFRLTGHRVRVTVTHGVTLAFGEPGSATLVGNISVQVSNHGRSPVTVSSLEWVHGADPKKTGNWMDWIGPAFPHRLEAQSEVNWRCEDVPGLARMVRLVHPGPEPTCKVAAILPGGRRRTSDVIGLDSETALSGVEMQFLAGPGVDVHIIRDPPDVTEPPQPGA